MRSKNDICRFIKSRCKPAEARELKRAPIQASARLLLSVSFSPPMNACFLSPPAPLLPLSMIVIQMTSEPKLTPIRGEQDKKD